MSETSKLSKNMRRAINRVGRKLVLDVNRRLGENTPVKTGWARSNWIASIRRPRTSPVGTPQNVMLTAPLAGVIAIKTWDMFRGPAFIANNVPYINLLNSGTSPKAPPGFVQMSIQQGISGLNNEKLR